jgi:hypothetical protein
MRRLLLILAALGLIFGTATGCGHHASRVVQASAAPPGFYHAVGLREPMIVGSVMAQCAPPEGWKPEPLKQSDRHTHQLWVSPSGNTGYGVAHFNLPLPLGVNLVHFALLHEMKKYEGRGVELSCKSDPSLPGLRIVAEGGKYKVRVNLICKGFDGWVVYAGTIRTAPENAAELELAERARENTVIGLPSSR